ncbi:uncharacterized protein LOC108892760 isoform X1 [Lates calcarifer]|uniref:Uncharacterized protein LOC108892760 isoform X1 n=1 Tax=Lates calcarifer TaxID=8187 RepID=A0AAJ8B2D6_LATCA|nr:uncharacterized protein LOC108892760 isoform X1 [Lates calcarifer]
MKTPSVSLLLGVSVLLLSGLTVSAVSLNVSPNRLQFFEGESVSLRCEGQVVSDGQTVKRTRGGQTEDCGPASGFGRFDGSSCIISGLSVSDSGGYWCEDRADQINISVINTVTDKAGVPVILEIPALPVMTGSDVTLRCRDKDNNRFKAFFFRDGKDLGSGPDGELTLSKVQQSHEGLYWCYRNKGVDSPQSRLRVRVVAALGSLVLLVLVLVGLVRWRNQLTSCLCSGWTPTSCLCCAGLFLLTAAGVSVLLLSGLTVSAGEETASCVPVVRLFCHLVVFCPYCICSVLLVLICCSRKTGNKAAVSMETTPPVGGGGEDEQYDDITADVTTEHEL